MPSQNPQGIWEEECSYIIEFQQIGERRNEAAKIGEKKCDHKAQGSMCELALSALRMHVDGRHQREIDARIQEATDEARRRKMADEREERRQINEERLIQLEKEAKVKITQEPSIK